MKRKLNWDLVGVLASATMLLFAQVASAQEEKVVPTHGEEFRGIVSVTTNSEGTASYITVPPAEDGKPLRAGFVVQYDPPTTSPINFAGPARALYNDDRPVERPLALRVEADDGSCWMFQTKLYGGRVPAGCQVVEGLVGLARYNLQEGAKGSPKTHGEFVRQQEEELAALANSPQDACDCAGGCGSSQCSCAGICSVTCNVTGYHACCGFTTGCHCLKGVCEAPAASSSGGAAVLLTANGQTACKKADSAKPRPQ